MSWVVEIGDEFGPELDALHDELQTEILALSRLLQRLGPQFGRPCVDTLKRSRHVYTKKLHFRTAGGGWRVAFVFDPTRKAILLRVGDKSGGSESRLYEELIRKVDEQFDPHPTRLERGRIL